MLNPVHHCLLLELLLRLTCSRVLTHPFEVCRIVPESHNSGHYLLCTAQLVIFKMEIAHYKCQFCYFYFIIFLGDTRNSDVTEVTNILKTLCISLVIRLLCY